MLAIRNLLPTGADETTLGSCTGDNAEAQVDAPQQDVLAGVCSGWSAQGRLSDFWLMWILETL